jgi:hypothetical protein
MGKRIRELFRKRGFRELAFIGAAAFASALASKIADLLL